MMALRYLFSIVAISYFKLLNLLKSRQRLIALAGEIISRAFLSVVRLISCTIWIDLLNQTFLRLGALIQKSMVKIWKLVLVESRGHGMQEVRHSLHIWAGIEQSIISNELRLARLVRIVDLTIPEIWRHKIHYT